MKKNFFICGLTGWCMEILFTSFGALRKKNLKLIGQTSIWMFPIYGMAAVIEPVSHHMKGVPTIFRGMVYSLGIFICEYVSGSLLKRHDLCPWDYSKAKFNIGGIIRLDYAPLWMAVGLIFEKLMDMLEKTKTSS